jgi:hypothetical protein
MSELRVPTVALAAEVLCADGTSVLGRIFLPAAASTHPGPMRAEEWANDPAPFFPFLPDDSASPVLLNKREVLVVSVPADADEPSELESTSVVEQRAIVECGGRTIEGSIHNDLREGQGRVLDYMNRPEPFLSLRDGKRRHLIQKRRISRVVEVDAD